MKNIFICHGLDLLSLKEIQKQCFVEKKIDIDLPNVLQKIEGKDISVAEAIDLCNSPILGSFYFIVIIENYSKCLKKKEELQKLLEKCPRECILFLIESDIKKSAIKKHEEWIKNHLQKINLFSVEKKNPYIKKYLLQKIKQEGLQIKEDAVTFLLEKFKENNSLLYGEIEKIISYCYKKKEITLDDIQEVTIALEKDIFQITKAIWGKNKNFYFSHIDRFLKKENLIGTIYFLQGDIKRKLNSYNSTFYSKEQLMDKLLMLFHIEKIIFSENMINPTTDSSKANQKALCYFHQFVLSF